MSNKQYDEFKQELKVWMDGHPKEYNKFVEKMNSKSFSGFIKVYLLAKKMAPNMIANFHASYHADLTSEEEFQSLCIDDSTTKSLIEEFNQNNRKSIVPAMLAWILFGKFYETMVFQLENLQKEKPGFLYGCILSIMIKYAMRASIQSKRMTKADWKKFYKEKKARENGEVGTLYIDELDNPGIMGRPKKDLEGISFSDYLLSDDKEMLLDKISKRLREKNSGESIAMIYIILQEDGLLKDCSRPEFHKLLDKELSGESFKLVGLRTFEVSHTRLMSTTGKGTLIKDISAEGIKLKELRSYLRAEMA